MTRRPLGHTGLDIAPIGLGGMPLSLSGRPSEADAVRVVHAAIDAGMDFIDTADVYCIDDHDIGHNERLIARALAQHPDGGRIVVATKGGLERPKGAWPSNGRPEHLRSACDKSLRALGVDSITLYQLHAPDEDVPFADSVGALAELRAAGKIRHVGLSNVSVDQVRAAQAIVPIESVQNRCNPFDRDAFHEGVVAHCAAEGITFLAYSPVNGSRGKGKIAVDPTLGEVSRRHGVSPYQVALAWLCAQSPVVVPIPGASRVASAVDSAAALRLALGPDDLAQLDSAFPTR